MNLTEIFDKSKVISVEDQIKIVKKGRSDAITAIIKKKNGKMFLKALECNIINHTRRINKIKTMCAIYHNVSVSSMKVIEASIINKKSHYILYDFIEGRNLAGLFPKLSNQELFNIGVKVGKTEKRLENHHVTIDLDDFGKVHENMITDATKWSKKFYELYFSNEMHYRKIFEKMPRTIQMRDIKTLELMMFNLSIFFDKKDLEVIHGDLNFGNIMLNKNYDVTLIDLDLSSYSYFVMSHKFIRRAIYFQDPIKQEKYRHFYSGLIHGRYDEIPPELNKQILYIIVRSFFWGLTKYMKKKNDEELIKHVAEFFEMFDSINIFKEKLSTDLLSRITKKSS